MLGTCEVHSSCAESSSLIPLLGCGLEAGNGFTEALTIERRNFSPTCELCRGFLGTEEMRSSRAELEIVPAVGNKQLRERKFQSLGNEYL